MPEPGSEDVLRGVDVTIVLGTTLRASPLPYSELP
jgi:hypothetical protein